MVVKRARMAGSSDEVDYDELFADRDRRARERTRRRQARRRRARGWSVTAASEVRLLAQTGAGRLLLGCASVLVLATAAGLVALWPHGAPAPAGNSTALGGATVSATVSAQQVVGCPGPVQQRCRRLIVSVEGQRTAITLGPLAATPSISAGTHVRVARVQLPEGAELPAATEHWSFVSVDRRGSIAWLAIALSVLALVVLRWRGLLALIGVAASLGLVTLFLVPAILHGESAILVALIASLAVTLVTLVLTNGIGAQTLAAALGIASTLLLAAILAQLTIGFVDLDGHSSELATYLGQRDARLSLTGIVVAAMVIGAVGVLADTGVTQASAVMALRKANPALSSRALYAAALRVGRDHLSATIHTLVLAYVGASLPLLLLLHSSGVGVTDAINTQDVAEPIVATIVGCIALIAAVPLTTALAAVLISRVPTTALGEHHGHGH